MPQLRGLSTSSPMIPSLVALLLITDMSRLFLFGSLFRSHLFLFKTKCGQPKVSLPSPQPYHRNRISQVLGNALSMRRVSPFQKDCD
ncbi:hypothetical protein BKA58DRAFT_395338 [Alternaria rosae]|uniref:uncharacterized protein n=1 Tax=Alternaria rosae TaxID=1187941 RepID=UPI001E8E0DDE|nr:uncharacterized protein BKA58DRAFT_395338 [Alternaria rosae]KAH6848482.1 hypothetical protein BKA58DRAFT_395338 [Alternaria rosae]